MGYTSERRWLRRAARGFRRLFPYLPQQSGYNKRLRAIGRPRLGSLSVVLGCGTKLG